MSMFYCCQCDCLSDSDEGAEAAPNGIDLICVDCAAENEEESTNA